MTIYKMLVHYQDEKYRSFQSRLVPNMPGDRMIGVRTPDLRSLARELFGTRACARRSASFRSWTAGRSLIRRALKSLRKIMGGFARHNRRVPPDCHQGRILLFRAVLVDFRRVGRALSRRRAFHARDFGVHSCARRHGVSVEHSRTVPPRKAR